MRESFDLCMGLRTKKTSPLCARRPCVFTFLSRDRHTARRGWFDKGDFFHQRAEGKREFRISLPLNEKGREGRTKILKNLVAPLEERQGIEPRAAAIDTRMSLSCAFPRERKRRRNDLKKTSRLSVYRLTVDHAANREIYSLGQIKTKMFY